MAMVEDLSVFFDTTEFAVAATYNGAATVNGIFDRAYLEPIGNNVQGSSPVFTCAEASIAAARHGDTLAIGARTYKVVGVEPDGTGMLLLRLEQQ